VHIHTHQRSPITSGYDLLKWYGDGTRVLIGCVVPSPTLQVKLWLGVAVETHVTALKKRKRELHQLKRFGPTSGSWNEIFFSNLTTATLNFTLVSKGVAIRDCWNSIALVTANCTNV